MKRLITLDVTLSQKFVLPVESGWRQWARLAAHGGDGPYVFGCLGLAYLDGWLQQDAFLRQTVLVIAMLVLATMAMITCIKYMVRRQRPLPPGEFVAFQYDLYSFPSGHSGRMAALSISTLFFYPPIGWLLLGLTLVTALARVTLGIHYISDVVVGLGIGAFMAWIGVALHLSSDMTIYAIIIILAGAGDDIGREIKLRRI